MYFAKDKLEYGVTLLFQNVFCGFTTPLAVSGDLLMLNKLSAYKLSTYLRQQKPECRIKI